MVLVVVARSIRDHVLLTFTRRDTCPPNAHTCESDGVSPSDDPSTGKEEPSDDGSHELGADMKGYIGVAVVCGLIVIGLVLWLTLAKYPRRKLRQWMDRARGETFVEEGSVAELDLKVKGERSREGTTTPSDGDRRLSAASPLHALVTTGRRVKEGGKEDVKDKDELPVRAVDTVHKVRQAYYL
ncbi:hypothetical protein EV121DRAFT_276952 [Schizophyllum commune]